MSDLQPGAPLPEDVLLRRRRQATFLLLEMYRKMDVPVDIWTVIRQATEMANSCYWPSSDSTETTQPLPETASLPIAPKPVRKILL